MPVIRKTGNPKIACLYKIIKCSNSNNLNILDFGCGIGNWRIDDIKSKHIKKITLFDKNKRLIKILKKRYRSKKIDINFNYNKVVKNKFFNLIIFSSVIQYMSPKELLELISKLKKNKKKLIIIITDIPYLPRFIEFLLLPFLNFKRFVFTLKLIFAKNYNRIDYFTYNKKYFIKFKNNFSIEYLNNLHDLKFLRYSTILKLK